MKTRAITETAELVRVEGVVQGVGFRPFVHRQATKRGLRGWVRNTSGSVEIAVAGDRDAIESFIGALRDGAPLLARVDAVHRQPRIAEDSEGFSVLASARDAGRLPVPPDAAICAPCARELFDPANRRYQYPFITCTDCGPRYSVIESLPYDRVRTSMRAFPLCATCAAEYADPANRRFHSETNSCAACGPRLWLADESGRLMEGDPRLAIAAAGGILARGGIVAVRGLGGFHLACDARNDAAVRRLRERKHREARPFAVMVADADAARRLAEHREADEGCLQLPERPIVVMRRRRHDLLAPSVAPGLDSIGVMIAYTPLHLLLLDAAGGPLVMTSGNRSDEPIAIGNAEAVSRLGGIADAFLLHDREIVARYDDSVVRAAPRAPVLLRRARGFAPLPLALPFATPAPLVAVGPHLKNTLALADGGLAWMSQHIGDLEDLAGMESWHAVYRRHCELFRVTPRVAVRDLHPGYLSTRIAADLGLERTIAVQHHHAHIAAVAAEHGVTAPVIGVAFDGTGYGDDGTIWGGEILVAGLARSMRAGHLRPVRLPGGDLAARNPWRSALAHTAPLGPQPVIFDAAFEGVPAEEHILAELQIRRGFNAPLTSSMGRLFDAAAAMLGIRARAQFEGQAAMELESAAGTRHAAALHFPIVHEEERWVMEPAPMLAELAERRAAGECVADLAAAFHESVAEATAEIVRRVALDEGLRKVVLAGGCFQNTRLLITLTRLLEEDGFQVLAPRRLPANDGAIAYGQAVVAAARLAMEG